MSQEVGNKLKAITANLIKSMKISDYSIGTVIRLEDGDPIIQLDSSQGPLPKACVAIPDYMKVYEVELTDGEIEADVEGGQIDGDHIRLKSVKGKITIDNSLKKDDKIYVLGKTGGQKYLVLGRIPEDAAD